MIILLLYWGIESIGDRGDKMARTKKESLERDNDAILRNFHSLLPSVIFNLIHCED